MKRNLLVTLIIILLTIDDTLAGWLRHGHKHRFAISTSSPTVHRALQTLQWQMNRKLSKKYLYKIGPVRSAFIRGNTYSIYFQFDQTECKRHHFKPLEQTNINQVCPIKEKNHALLCHAEITLANGVYKLLEFNFKPGRTKFFPLI